MTWTPTYDKDVPNHSFIATRKDIPKGESRMPDGRRWAEVCDDCGQELMHPKHRVPAQVSDRDLLSLIGGDS